MVSSVGTADVYPSVGMFFDNLVWLNSKEAAKFLRRSVGQIRNMVYRGQIKARKWQGRLLFKKSELNSLVENSLF